MRNRITLLLAALLLAGAAAGAQELVFFEGDVTISEVVDAGDPFIYRSEDIYFGFQLGPDFIVETGSSSYAEIVLPNGHILKLADDTEVRLDSVVARAESGSDRVSVSRGRLRSVVANLTGSGRQFLVNTPTAVGGVRGTDFVTQVLLNAAGVVTQEAIGVLEGVVGFAQSGGQEIVVGAGQFADALGPTFQAQAGNIAAQFYGGLQELSQQAQEAANQITESLAPEEDEEPAEEEPPADEQDEDEDEGEDEPGEDEVQDPEVQSAAPSVVAEEPAPTEPEESGDDGGPDIESPVDLFIADLTEALGIEIGTITKKDPITDEPVTWSKLVAQPTFQIGKLRAGLYLPVIYQSNIFDPSDWYRPKGNDEWSFGTDQDWRNDTLNAMGDLVGDIALKIKFLEWGQQRDPFFFKVGNLSTLTLGHGLLMRNYANDTEFPEIRRVGFNLGLDPGRIGFETVVNDLAAPEIFGARIFVRPIANFPMAVGVSGVADIGPARDLTEQELGDTPEQNAKEQLIQDARTADPVFLNVALDLDLPVIERDALSLILFGDVGGLLPYLRAPVTGLSDEFQTQALWYDPGTGYELRNYGIASGVFGNISILDYRLEFRNYHGAFQPAFYDANYDGVRGDKAAEVIEYLQNPDADDYKNETLGVYGEAGFTIADLVRLEAGYMWPFGRNPDTNEIETGDDDILLASLMIREGLLPLGISAGVHYERTHFVPTLFDWEGYEDADLLDADTVFGGEIVYPVAPIVDIAISLSTQKIRDGSGNIVYDPETLRQQYQLIWSIDTRIGGAGE